jgi:hypothetical protein
MASKWLVFLLFFVLIPSVSAWGDYTDQYFCDTVVKEVWGGKVFDECLSRTYIEDQQKFCGMLEEKRQVCMNMSGPLHPAVMPNALGEGDLQHANTCPINMYPDETYLCASKTEALDKARYWLNRSAFADTTCDRIYLFCVASNYMAQTYNPLNWVLHEDEKCRDIFNRKVDFDVRENQSSWGVTQVCVFDYVRPAAGGDVTARYSQSISISRRTVDKVLENLTAEVRALKAFTPRIIVKTTTTTLTSTTTTTIRPTPARNCVADGDCVAVKSDCCGCTAGGENIAINREFKAGWELQLDAECKGIACPAVMSQHPSCFSTPACVDNTCTLKPTAPSTTIPVTPTTVPTTTTIRVTTTITPPTTLPEKREGSNILLYLVFLLVLACGTVLVLRRHEVKPPEQKKSGLMALGGRETKIGSRGYSRLSGADGVPRARERPKAGVGERREDTIPVKKREREFPGERREYIVDTGTGGEEKTAETKETKEPVRKRGAKSLIQHAREGTSLGEIGKKGGN